MKQLENLLKLPTQRKIIFGLVLIVFLLAIFFTKFITSLLLISFAILLSWVVKALNIKVIGLELVTFTIVIFGYIYGSWIGGIFGLILILTHLILSQSFGGYVIWVVPEYIAAGVMAALFASTKIFILGTIIISTIATVNILLTFLFYRFNLGKYLVFYITNVVFNIFLFLMFGETVVSILG